MPIRLEHPHPWQVDYRTAVAIQEDLRRRLVLKDRAPRKIRRIAGADISSSRDDNRAYAAVIVLDAETLETLEEVSCAGEVVFPYIPGLLTFREGPILLDAFRKLSSDPDAILFDGQGIAHPRGLGLAAHMGVLLDLPAVGCAKTRLIGTFAEPGWRRGSRSPLLHEGREIGAVLRTRDGVKPLFVSPGHKVSLDRAVEIVLACTGRYRIAEPIRRAHMLVGRMRKEAQEKGFRRVCRNTPTVS